MLNLNLAFTPEDVKQGSKLAHYLAFKGIPFEIGTTVGKKRPLVVVRNLNLRQYIEIRINVGRVDYLENVSYYIVKKVNEAA